MSGLLKVDDVAKLLNVSSAWVYQKVSSGEFPHYKMGGAVRFSQAHIASFLESKEQGKARVVVKPLKNLTLEN